MPAHTHGQGEGPRPSRFGRTRRRTGAGVDDQTIGEPGARRQKMIIVSGSIALAAAAGLTLFISAIFGARQVPYSVRLYAGDPPAGEDGLARVTAYDSGERAALAIDAVSGEGVAPAPGLADGAAVVRIPRGERPVLSIETARGKRTLRVPPRGRGEKPSAPTIRPVSAELRTGPPGAIGIGTRGGDEDEAVPSSLDDMKVLLYPAQGRLASNLPNTIYAWARGCPAGRVALRTAAGEGELVADAAGMASFVFSPTLNATWFDVACGEFRQRLDLRDRPAGIVTAPAVRFARPGEEVRIDVHTLTARRPLTMDVYRGCAWIDSRAVVPAAGEAQVVYTLPAESGVYSFEFYGNVHTPGDERARTRVIAIEGDLADVLRGQFVGVTGAGIEPIVAHLEAVLARAEPLPAGSLALLAGAALSRREGWCGPPPLVHDSYETDALFLKSQKAGVKKAAFTGIGATWIIALLGAILIMALRIKASHDAEERIAGHKKHIALQHALAAAIITVVFALIIYTLDVWWQG